LKEGLFLSQACRCQAYNLITRRIVIYCRSSQIRRESSQAKEKNRNKRRDAKRKKESRHYLSLKDSNILG